jgi:hypothetical protein
MTKYYDGTSNIEIENVLSRFTKLKYFRGVHPSNRMPHDLLSLNKFSIICNLLPDTTTIVGHWIAIRYENGVLLYLDPLNVGFSYSSVLMIL